MFDFSFSSFLSPYLEVDCILIGEFHCSGILGVNQVVVFRDEAHKVRNLADHDAVGSCQAAGRCQVAAGVAGFQGRGSRRRTGADGAAAAQVRRVDVNETCGTRYETGQERSDIKIAVGFIYNLY